MTCIIHWPSQQIRPLRLGSLLGEYNDADQQITTDFLASFTYIPGTVFHVGYGSLYEKGINTRQSYETNRRSFFIKAAYNWRL